MSSTLSPSPAPPRAGAILYRAGDLAEHLAEANIAACLQCRKCTSGCPVAVRADIKPHELIRLIQLGQSDEVLTSTIIWECTSCQTCATRCPQKVSIAAMNDALRRISKSRGKATSRTTVVIFNEVFLNSVKKMGRMYEVGLMATFKLRTRRFFDDMGKLPLMLSKGKLALFPKTVPGKAARQAMFDRAKNSPRLAGGNHPKTKDSKPGK